MAPRYVPRRIPPYSFARAVSGNISALITGLKYFIAPNRLTLDYPREYVKLRRGYRGFIVLNKSKCIGCEACARICPAAAMKMVKVKEYDEKRGREVVKKYPVINYQRCIFCGYCVDVCPVEALYHVPVHDVVYFNLEDMKTTLESFQVEPRSPAEGEGVPVKYVFDPVHGLVKVKAEEGGDG
ncbi:NADH-quinone oxidoreductase subunit NuoI [Stetteria hydrogenophila]